MLYEQLRDDWNARERSVPINPVMTFRPEGLVLGAGTVLGPAEGVRRLRSLKGQEARLMALLSTAYGRAVPLRVLGNIERAGQSWNDCNDCLAYIHLAHSGLQTMRDPRSAACQLFIADSVMKTGVSPRAILQALKIGSSYIEAIEKLYNPDEPRVPAGSGRTSGQWTRALSWLDEIAAAQVQALGLFALRYVAPQLSGAAAVFGLLFIPSPKKLSIEGEVSGISGLRYVWNRDERLLHLTYEGTDGEQHTFTAELQEDVFRDQRGQVVGRVLPGGNIVVDPATISPDLVQDDEPRLCPAPGPDKPGNDLGREYENYVKSIVNPFPKTTPSGIGFQLPNPEESGKLVYYDDCQHATGMMVDAKGPGYAGLLSFQETMKSVVYEWLDESGRQIAASGGRPVRWYFAEWEAKVFAGELFADAKGGREKIEVEYLPWSKRGPL